MRRKQLIALLSAVVFLTPQLALADMSSLGKREYESNCASCHGQSGKGDGPLSGYLEKKPTDLTQTMKNNNGVFPFSLMTKIIDGRQAIALHGTRDMPAWGHEYNDKAVQHYQDYFKSYDSESFVKARILALTEYIYSLQDK